MALKKICAIIREEAWEEVIENLEQTGVKGATVSIIKGYGEYLNAYRKDGLDSHAKIEIFADANEIEAIIDTIMETAHTGLEGDGIVSVLPVEQVYRVRSKSKMNTGA